MRKITSSVSGMMMASRRCGALLRFILARPVDVVARRQFHLLASTFAMASSTVPPRSRPRTLYLIAT